MAIFLGSWLDDAGDPFDPASFAISTRTSTDTLIVTGNPDPDCTGVWKYAGQHAGYPYYESPDTVYKLYHYIDVWAISTIFDDFGPGAWVNPTPEQIEGTYFPYGPYTGDVVVAWARSGTSRQRIFGRRGGSGSPPGHHHGNAMQAAERLAFGNAARRYVDMPEASPETEWERDGDHKNWLVRSGATKTMHGQAFYPRTSVPQDYVGGVCDDSPDVTATVSPLASLTFYYDPVTNECNLTIFSEDTTWYGADGGFSIFQINPRAAGKDWERKHTRLVWSTSTWGQSDTGAEYVFTPAWPADVATGIRILAIGRNNVAFIHYGPIDSTAAP